MDIDAYRRKLQQRAKTNRIEFEGLYREELTGLAGLSPEQLARITPDTTAPEVCAQLITVVQEASATNVAQAELRNRIEKLGNVAISIAQQFPKLAALFA